MNKAKMFTEYGLTFDGLPFIIRKARQGKARQGKARLSEALIP